MNPVEYARKELELAGLFDEDSDYGGTLGSDAVEIVEKFAAQGHSGFGAEMLTQILERLLRFRPLTSIQQPVEGDWVQYHGVDCISTCHHKRDPRLLSDDDGRSWYTIAAADGARREVRFPYWPDDI